MDQVLPDLQMAPMAVRVVQMLLLAALAARTLVSRTGWALRQVCLFVQMRSFLGQTAHCFPMSPVARMHSLVGMVVQTPVYRTGWTSGPASRAVRNHLP